MLYLLIAVNFILENEMLNVSFNNLSYHSIRVSAKDFTTLCEIFERAIVTDYAYLETPDGSKIYDIEKPRVTLEARTKLNPLVTQAEFDQMKAEAEAAKCM